MDNYIFVAQGDLAQLSAHAVTYSANTSLFPGGELYSGFEKHLPAFVPAYEALPRPCNVGAAHWLPMSDRFRPHGVVVVASTGGAEAVELKRELAVRAAIDTAVAELRRSGVHGRLLVALPAFRTGQGGDRRHVPDSARTQVEAARQALRRHEAVDVAFITYTPSVYRVFLEARRQVLGPPTALPGGDPPTELVNAVAQGECVLFVGAGMSQGAGLPAWGELIAHLAADLGVKPRGDLDFYLDLAQWYVERFGHAALATVVRRVFGRSQPDVRPTLAHYLLAGFPSRYQITTNYDDLLKETLTALRRHPVKVVRQEDVADTGRLDDTFVVKLHGDATEGEGIVLSRDDFDDFFARRPAMAALLEGLLLNQTFFFVGYGLKDPNFRQIHTRIGRMLRGAQRHAFATTFEEEGDSGAYLTEQWKKKGLHLLRIPGGGRDEQQYHLLRLLDRLAEGAAGRTPRLLLAPAAGQLGRLVEVRRLLRETGGAVAEACDVELSAEEARQVAGVLQHLVDAGWRPVRPLWRLWEALARRVPDGPERRALLVTALRHTESFGAAARVREQLAKEG